MISVVQIGPDPQRSQGGMATVIGNILSAFDGNDAFRQILYPSFIGGNAIKRVAYAEFQKKRFDPKKYGDAIFHIHLGPGRSAWRKLDYLKSIGPSANRVLIHVHASTFDDFFLGLDQDEKEQIRGSFNSVARVLVLSEEWRDFFSRNSVCDDSKITILHNAVEVPIECSVDYGSEGVLFMGCLGDRKSPDTLIKAIPHILKAHPDAFFTFAGDGDTTFYKQLASNLGVADHCVFAGWVSGAKKENLYQTHSIYCLPSKNEGMPMSVLEAMAHGLSVVTTPVGGVAQIVDNEENGFLVGVDDVEGFVDRINRLLDSISLRSAIGGAGRERIISKFSMQSYVNMLTELYTEVVR